MNQIKQIDGSEINDDNDRAEYLHQICCFFQFLGEVTQSKIKDDGCPAYTIDADYGHYLAFQMAINELRKFGDLVGCHTEATTVFNHKEATGGEA
ncbi:MAG: hypothetical protein C0392_04945 [Syntrophus sp. (in: bacteria)]|nr:hypothetical protein [Syntrophus sp. (in: bacteria)]